MKRVATILLALIVASPLSAQSFKLEESSAKKAPAWVNGIEAGQISASASASTLEIARDNVLISIKSQIAQSVVSQISVETEHRTSSIETKGGMDYSIETESIARSITEQIPALQAISLNKATDYYYEIYFDKKSNQRRYDYYVLYPFSDEECRALINEYNAQQSEINSIINSMRDQIETFGRVEDIASNIETLQGVIPRLGSDDARIGQINELMSRYRNQYKNISMVAIEHSDKRIVIALFIDGRKVSTSQLPSIKSNCADRYVLPKRIDAKEVIIEYDDYVCRSGEDNWIDISFRFSASTVSTRVHI